MQTDSISSYIAMTTYFTMQNLSAIMVAIIEEHANLQTHVNVLQDGLEIHVHKVHSYMRKLRIRQLNTDVQICGYQ